MTPTVALDQHNHEQWNEKNHEKRNIMHFGYEEDGTNKENSKVIGNEESKSHQMSNCPKMSVRMKEL